MHRTRFEDDRRLVGRSGEQTILANFNSVGHIHSIQSNGDRIGDDRNTFDITESDRKPISSRLQTGDHRHVGQLGLEGQVINVMHLVGTPSTSHENNLPRTWEETRFEVFHQGLVLVVHIEDTILVDIHFQRHPAENGGIATFGIRRISTATDRTGLQTLNVVRRTMTHGHSETTHGLVVHTHNHTFDVGPVRKGVTRPGIKGNSHTCASTSLGTAASSGVILSGTSTV